MHPTQTVLNVLLAGMNENQCCYKKGARFMRTMSVLHFVA